MLRGPNLPSREPKKRFGFLLGGGDCKGSSLQSPFNLCLYLNLKEGDCKKSNMLPFLICLYVLKGW